MPMATPADPLDGYDTASTLTRSYSESTFSSFTNIRYGTIPAPTSTIYDDHEDARPPSYIDPNLITARRARQIYFYGWLAVRIIYVIVILILINAKVVVPDPSDQRPWQTLLYACPISWTLDLMLWEGERDSERMLVFVNLTWCVTVYGCMLADHLLR